MKVAIGTIEVDDDVRRVIRRAKGEDGLASRDEVRRIAIESLRKRLSELRVEASKRELTFAWDRGEGDVDIVGERDATDESDRSDIADYDDEAS